MQKKVLSFYGHFNYYENLFLLRQQFYHLSHHIDPMYYLDIHSLNFGDFIKNNQIPNTKNGPLEFPQDTLKIELRYDFTMPDNADISKWHLPPFLFLFYLDNNYTIINKLKEVLKLKKDDKLLKVEFLWFDEELDAKLILKTKTQTYLVRFMFKDFYDLNLKDWKKRKFDETLKGNPLVPFFNYEAQKELLDYYSNLGINNIPKVHFAGTLNIPVNNYGKQTIKKYQELEKKDKEYKEEIIKKREEKKKEGKVYNKEQEEEFQHFLNEPNFYSPALSFPGLFIDDSTYKNEVQIEFLVLNYIEGTTWLKTKKDEKNDEKYSEQIANFFYLINNDEEMKKHLKITRKELKKYFKYKLKVFYKLKLDIETYKKLQDESIKNKHDKNAKPDEYFEISEDFANGKRYFENGKEIKNEYTLNKEYITCAKVYLELVKKYLRTICDYKIYCYTDFATFNTIINKDENKAYLIDFNRLSVQFGFRGIAGGIIGRFKSDEDRVVNINKEFRKKLNKKQNWLYSNALLDEMVGRIFSLKDKRLREKDRKEKKDRYLRMVQKLEI